MVEGNKKAFWSVYNKTINIAEKKLKQNLTNRKYGGKVNYTQLKTLLLYITYLENIKNSKYNYKYVDSLTEISNNLNKI